MAEFTFVNPALTTTNVGDLFIEDGIRRILAIPPENTLNVDPRIPLTHPLIDQINQTRAAVILGTNLWYHTLFKPGRWMWTLTDLKKIRVPIIPLGIGTTRHLGEDNSFDSETASILRHIHENCEASSVRDMRTAEALEAAGIRNVILTGCPTLFRSLQPRWTCQRNPEAESITLTVRHGQKPGARMLGKLIDRLGYRPVVAAQQKKDQFLKRIGVIPGGVPTLFKFDIRPYLDLVSRSCGAIGWRLHGNMLHLSAGRPAVFFANCSRVQSFCETFGLPWVDAPDHRPVSMDRVAAPLRELFADAPFRVFAVRYAHYYRELARFLSLNGLPHHLRASAARRVA